MQRVQRKRRLVAARSGAVRRGSASEAQKRAEADARLSRIDKRSELARSPPPRESRLLVVAPSSSSPSFTLTSQPRLSSQVLSRFSHLSSTHTLDSACPTAVTVRPLAPISLAFVARAHSSSPSLAGGGGGGYGGGGGGYGGGGGGYGGGGAGGYGGGGYGAFPLTPTPLSPASSSSGTARVAQLGAACTCTDSYLPLAPLLQAAAAVLAASAAADSAVAATAVRCSSSSRAPLLGSRTDAPLPSQ